MMSAFLRISEKVTNRLTGYTRHALENYLHFTETEGKVPGK